MIVDTYQSANSRPASMAKGGLKTPFAWRFVVLPSRHALDGRVSDGSGMLRVDPSHPLAAPFVQLNWTMEVGQSRELPAFDVDATFSEYCVADSTIRKSAAAIGRVDEFRGPRTIATNSILATSSNQILRFDWNDSSHLDCNARNIFRLTRRERKLAANTIKHLNP